MRKPIGVVFFIIIISITSLCANSLENDCRNCCKIPKDFANGKLRTIQRESRGRSIVPERSVLQFKCDENYVLRGKNHVICKNGAWSSQLPICAAIDNSIPRSQSECKSCCEIPKKFPNGKVRTLDKDIRGISIVSEFRVIEFKCNDGYIFERANISVCVKGEWLPEIPNCIQKSCSSPPSIDNGRLVSNITDAEFSMGTEISYECNEGYQLVQESKLLCVRLVNDLIWAGELPQCKETVKCEDPGDDGKGHREGPCCEVGDVVNYSCIEEYKITGPLAIRCTEDGTWNSTRPRCQPEIFCEDPGEISNGKIKIVRKARGDFYLPEDQIMIICEEGYTVGNESDFLYCDIDGRWDEDIPKCTSNVSCDIPEPPENGYILELKNNINLTSVTYNFEINFVCRPGYTLIGDSWRSCDAYGWTNENPKCREIQCPDPGRPENGWTQGYDFRIGNVTYFGCDSGYILLGSSIRVCMENGQWNGELSRCDTKDNYCPNPGNPIGGTKSGNRYEFDSEVTFECNPDRILIGSANRTCQSNRKWSGEETICFGQNDFDDKRAVGYKIKSLLEEENINQEVELVNYEYEIQRNEQTDDGRSRFINLNSPDRLIFVFIFDVSGSVGKHNFKKSIDFAKAMVKVIRVSKEGARVGAITFSSKASKEFNPVDYENSQDVIDALDKIEYKKGGTATSSALQLLKEEMLPLTIEVLGKSSKFIAFLMTDGKVNMAGNPIHDADFLKEENNVEIYCVGINGDRKMQTLYDIASTKDKHVFILDGYDSLDWLVQDIVNDTVDYLKCGVRQSTAVKIEKEDKRGRVINGMKVHKAWPWMAVIYFVDPNKPDKLKASGICGATVIDRKWLLTAAHCMINVKNGRAIWRNTREFIINLGLIDMNNNTNIQQRSVLRYITHPLYNNNTYDYDIALIELSTPVEYNKFVRPVCLPPPEDELHKEPTFYRAGRVATVVGWGYDQAVKEKDLPKVSNHVKEAREVTLNLEKRPTCQDSLIGRPENNIFTERMICAGGDGKDACKGDSGGPLMQMLTDDIGEEIWTEVGLVSWGIGCGQPNRYGFYTKVSMFREWIEETKKTP